jgi:hypothetical protein
VHSQSHKVVHKVVATGNTGKEVGYVTLLGGALKLGHGLEAVDERVV